MSKQESKFNNKIFTNIKKKIYNINNYKDDESDESDEEDEYINKIYIFKNLNFVKCTIKPNYNILKILKDNHNFKIQNILKDHKILAPHHQILPSNQLDSPNFINSVGGGDEDIFEKSFSYNIQDHNIDNKIEDVIKEMLKDILNSQNHYVPEYNNFHIIYNDIGSYYEGEGSIKEFLKIN